MTVEHVELAVIIVQLQRVTPALTFVRAGVAKLLAFFKLETTTPAPAPEGK